MPAPPCPECGSATRIAGYDPWCPACGWNREKAEEKLRRSTRAIPVYYLLAVTMFGLFFRVWKSPQPMVLLFVFVMPLVPLVLLYASLRWSRSRFERDVQEAAAGMPLRSTSAAEPAAAPSSEEFKLLRELPRPRPVRMSRRGKFNLAVVALATGGLALFCAARVYQRYAVKGSLDSLTRADWIWLGFVLLLAFLPFATWKNVKKQRDLMANGEVALARVLRRMGDQSSPTIQYEFEDARGQRASAMATDMTRLLYEGMSVPVFFDAQDPTRRVAQCECFCEVVLPGRD